ncbi:ATP-binding cassette domain-containing protein [Nonomuraea maheshkhaliensis]|uniref:ATP-binding cassette domain-containing protein n=1 Tax=Nonomuraea maheshkhaliensis TaxID=419590 RepID=UPI0031F894BE
MKDAIEAETLVKRYGDQAALDGIDLAVRTGTVLGVLGPDGAGETTAVRVLATLVTPDAGRAVAGGHDVVRHPARVRELIGLTGQHASVDEQLTGTQNLLLIARLLGLSRAAARARAADLLARFGLEEEAAGRRCSSSSSRSPSAPATGGSADQSTIADSSRQDMAAPRAKHAVKRSSPSAALAARVLSAVSGRSSGGSTPVEAPNSTAARSWSPRACSASPNPARTINSSGRFWFRRPSLSRATRCCSMAASTSPLSAGARPYEVGGMTVNGTTGAPSCSTANRLRQRSSAWSRSPRRQACRASASSKGHQAALPPPKSRSKDLREAFDQFVRAGLHRLPEHVVGAQFLGPGQVTRHLLR